MEDNIYTVDEIKPTKYRRPWKESFKRAAESFFGGAAIALLFLVGGAVIVGALYLVIQVSWLFALPIAAIVFIIMVLAYRFDP